MQNDCFKNRALSLCESPASRIDACTWVSTIGFPPILRTNSGLVPSARSSLRRSNAVSWLLTAMLLAFAGLPAAAQYTSNVQGTVFDPSNRAIAGAGVTLTNNANGLISNTQTNDLGIYRFENVPPGNYSITVTANG